MTVRVLIRAGTDLILFFFKEAQLLQSPSTLAAEAAGQINCGKPGKSPKLRPLAPR
jgi:hypothetical protein